MFQTVPNREPVRYILAYPDSAICFSQTQKVNNTKLNVAILHSVTTQTPSLEKHPLLKKLGSRKKTHSFVSILHKVHLARLHASKAYYSGTCINPYPIAFPYGNGMILHFYQQQESSTTKTVHRVINKGLKTYVYSLHTGENFH